MAGSGRIGVLVEPEMLSVIPGQPAIAQVTVVNLGSIVDWFTITVGGGSTGVGAGAKPGSAA